MTQEFIIMDASVTFVNARNILQEGLLFYGNNDWGKDLNRAKKYPNTTEAINEAIILKQELPVKVLLVQNDNGRIGVGEVKF